MRNYYEMLNAYNQKNKEEQRQEIEALNQYVNQREHEETIKDFHSDVAGPTNHYVYTARKYEKKEVREYNPRIFFCKGHSSIKNLETGPKIDRGFSRGSLGSLEKWRILQLQSVGRFNYTEIGKLFNIAMEKDPNFYEAVTQVNTDGEAGNLNKLFIKSLLDLDRFNFHKIDTYSKLYKGIPITDFEIYPKPLNPDLDQAPLQRTYTFAERTEKGILPPYLCGIFEVTRLNEETGLYEYDPFMYSEKLMKLFEPQRKRASIDKNYGIDKIQANLLIPDKDTKILITNDYGKDFLDKLERMNSINKKILEEYKQFENQTSLHYESLSISILYRLLFDEIYDLEGNSEKDDDILIIETGCKSFSSLIKFPVTQGNQFRNNTLTSYRNQMSSFKPRRSKSRNE